MMLRALGVILAEVLAGVVHSTLVTIDGGSVMSEQGQVRLVNAETREDLTEGALHEEFAEYQAEHGII